MRTDEGGANLPALLGQSQSRAQRRASGCHSGRLGSACIGGGTTSVYLRGANRNLKQRWVCGERGGGIRGMTGTIWEEPRVSGEGIS